MAKQLTNIIKHKLSRYRAPSSNKKSIQQTSIKHAKQQTQLKNLRITNKTHQLTKWQQKILETNVIQNTSMIVNKRNTLLLLIKSTIQIKKHNIDIQQN